MLLSPLFTSVVILVWSLKSSKALQTKNVELGQPVILKCDMSYHHEINWVRMNENIRPQTLMVMGLKNDGTLSVAWNSNETQFEGCITERFIGLKIFQVSKSDLATYLCAASNGKRMEFGEGTQLQTVNVVQVQSQSTEDLVISNNSEKPFHTHLILASALSFGLLLLVFTIIIVHFKTNKR